MMTKISQCFVIMSYSQFWQKLASSYLVEKGIEWGKVKQHCFSETNGINDERDEVMDEEIFKVTHYFPVSN